MMGYRVNVFIWGIGGFLLSLLLPFPLLYSLSLLSAWDGCLVVSILNFGCLCWGIVFPVAFYISVMGGLPFETSCHLLNSIVE